jgi:hypothetical protein
MRPGYDIGQSQATPRRTHAAASGPSWCDKFPVSRSLSALTEPFRSNAGAFVDALRLAGAVVAIGMTRMPQERAYLMYWSWRIATGVAEPARVPAMLGIEIDWTHGGNAEAAHTSAILMKHQFGIKSAPPLHSRHTEGRAFHMKIQFGWALLITDRKKRNWPVACQSDLLPVGERYGVVRRIGASHHWSDDGK